MLLKQFNRSETRQYCETLLGREEFLGNTKMNQKVLSRQQKIAKITFDQQS